MGAMRKQLPSLPKTNDTPGRYYAQHDDDDSATPGVGAGRTRAMTTSSYASTAIPPKLEADLNFDNSGFDDLFSGLERKASPDFTTDSPGRSLLAGRRTVQTEPIKIDRKLEVEPPPKSWDSRGSGDHLIASPTEDNSTPPPVPPHKYAPIASDSPDLNGSGGFEDMDAKLVRQSVQARKSQRENSSEQKLAYTSPSVASLQTPLSSSSASNTTPKAALRAPTSPTTLDDDNLFAPSTAKQAPARKPAAPIAKENIPPPPSAPGEPTRRVMTVAEFQAQKQMQLSLPPDESSDEEDYEDEEDAIRKREEEQKAIRQRQQMQIAREHMRRSTTAPVESNEASNGLGVLSNGFPSETSLQADQWSDEDVPLGVLAQHGFPARNKPPSQPANAMPSYFRSSTPTIPDRPASAGAVNNRASNGYRPPFARNLPDDPYASVIGGGLVQQTNRESMGFNRGAASVYNEPVGGMPYDPQPQFTSLVDQIQMRDMAKQKYMGGASSKKPPGGPFTGALSNQMNAAGQNNYPTRMSTMGMAGTPGMSGMSGMPGMPGMNPMMMNMMGGSMPMMGMNQMQFPMYQQNELMMQQMMQQMLQMQAQQNAMFGQQQQQQQLPPQDPRMSMAPQQNPGFQTPQFQNNSFLNVSSAMPNQQRPMSIMSANGNQQNRPFSSLAPSGAPSIAGFQPQMPMNNGYTPSIAPSERSNIGLSARYRSVATGNGMQDTQSTVSSMTLQASGGATESKKVKGILKNKAPQVTVKEDDEDDWGKMAARKSKFAQDGDRRNGAASSAGLHELVRNIDGY